MRHAPYSFLALPALLALLTAPAGSAETVLPPDPGQASRMDACIKLADSDPDRALAEAQALWNSGAAFASRQCIGLALIAQGNIDRGVEVLTGLGRSVAPGYADTAARVFAMAGRALLGAGRSARAEAVFAEALGRTPANVDILVDRAIARGTQAKYWEALDDLNRAIALAPGRADAWLFRATAYRRLNVPDLAAENADKALELAPGMADAWLERGILHHLESAPEKARAAWLKAAELDPDGPAGQAARANLDRMR